MCQTKNLTSSPIQMSSLDQVLSPTLNLISDLILNLVETILTTVR